jgi:hypothetical protein
VRRMCVVLAIGLGGVVCLAPAASAVAPTKATCSKATKKANKGKCPARTTTTTTTKAAAPITVASVHGPGAVTVTLPADWFAVHLSGDSDADVAAAVAQHPELATILGSLPVSDLEILAFRIVAGRVTNSLGVAFVDGGVDPSTFSDYRANTEALGATVLSTDFVSIDHHDAFVAEIKPVPSLPTTQLVVFFPLTAHDVEVHMYVSSPNGFSPDERNALLSAIAAD